MTLLQDWIKSWWRYFLNPWPLVGTRWRVDQLGIVYIKTIYIEGNYGTYKRHKATTSCKVVLVTPDGEITWLADTLRSNGVPLKATASDIKILSQLGN